MNYTIFDVETTMKCPLGNAAHPMWPGNHVVMVGALTEGGLPSVWDERGSCSAHLAFARCIVGHNIKFDLLYALKHDYLNVLGLTRTYIWDTQLAEYLLTGQQAQYSSLDSLTVQYGGTVKDSAVTEFFKAGKGADEVPTAMLADYLKGDLLNTELIYLAQRKKAEEWGMLPLLQSQMNALRATTIMEWNGMKVDSKYIDKKIVELTIACDIEHKYIQSELDKPTSRHFPNPLSHTSNKDLSLFLFGGECKEEYKEEVGTYKGSGLPKYKKAWRTVKVEPIFNPETVGAELNAFGYYTVDEKVLKNIGTPFTESILRYRTFNKQKTTYYENMRDLMFPNGHIYPSLNHVATKTGRLSCTKPNIQNQTEEGGIKGAYVSRWGYKGRLVEFDYSQLEMVALAYLANDHTLIADIGGGKDMHTELFIDMYSRPPTKDERKWFKRLSFGLVYGAGAKTLAENAGCTVAEAKKFISVFYGRYPGVQIWHEETYDVAKKQRKVSKEHCPVSKRPVGKYVMNTPTTRRYVFKEYFNEWKKDMSFSPTELKNYPVQGFATGDVVPHMVGYIVEKLAGAPYAEQALPIMTVHDSILFDVHEDVVDKFVNQCYNALKNTTKIVNDYFNIDLPIVLDVGCKVGLNWLDMKEIDFKKGVK